MICTDQQRTDTLRCYDPETQCQTPAIDALAAEGTVFDNAYTSCPVCSPARSSLQSGLYPSRVGIDTNVYNSGCRANEIGDMPELISRRLGRIGYSCAYTGKWHLGVGKRKESSEEGAAVLSAWKEKKDMSFAPYLDYGNMPTDLGYIGDDFPGHGQGGWKYPQFKEYLKSIHKSLEIEETTKIRKIPGDHITVGEVKSGTDTTVEYYLGNRAIELTRQMMREGKPFFMSLNFWGPHEPYYASTEYLDIYRDMKFCPWPNYTESPENQPKILDILRRPEAGWDFFEDSLRHYYACMTMIDAQIGRYIDFLKAEHVYDDTEIIFLSDHGDYQGSHGKLENKGYGFYDEITKIPLIVKPVKGETFSPHVSALVGTCDVYATILDAAGFVPGDSYGFGDGRSLIPLMKDPHHEWDDEIVTEATGVFNTIETERMYRKGDYKYCFYSSGFEQLFNMKEDKYELHNLAGEKPEILQQMRQDFSFWLKRKGMIDFYNCFSKLYRINEWNR